MIRTPAKPLTTALALFAALLALAGCDRQAKEQIAQLQAKVQSLDQKVDSLTAERTAAAQQASDLQTRLDALTAQREDLKVKLAASETQVKQLQTRVDELAKAPTPPPAPAATPAAAQAPADLAKVRARLDGLGADLFQQGDYNAANAVLLCAHDLGSNAPLTLYRLAYTNAASGEYPDAVGWYERTLAALELEPNADNALRAKCLSNYAVALTRTGKVQQAVTAYGKALAIDPPYPPALYNLALLYAHNTGEPEKAIEALRRYVAQGGTRSVSARDLLRELLAQQPQSP